MNNEIQAYPDEKLRNMLPWPKEQDNKYSRGTFVLVAGCAKYPGAACLATTAAFRSGAGYVLVSCSDEAASILRAWQPSAVVRPWSLGLCGGIQNTQDKPAAYAIGPGFDSIDELCVNISRKVVVGATDFRVPLLIDGGALGALSDDIGLPLIKAYSKTGSYAVLTPHGGEAIKLAKIANIPAPSLAGGEEIASASLAQSLSDAFQAVVVLKGPNTYIAQPDTAVCTVKEGTSVLAKAGTGDVLVGIIGGLLAQGLHPWEAALLGTTLHARSGEAAAKKLTRICATAEDVLDAIPEAIKTLM